MLYHESDEDDHVVMFGVSSWTGYFFLSASEENYNIDSLWERAEKFIPKEIRESHPENNKLRYLKIYKLKCKKVRKISS